MISLYYVTCMFVLQQQLMKREATNLKESENQYVGGLKGGRDSRK